MPYNVYPRGDGAEVSHVEFNANKGIRGRLTKKPDSLGSSDSIADAIEIAYAYLGRNPSDAVYIADDDDLVHDVIFNDGYHAEQSNNEQWLCSSIALLVLCFTSLVASTIFHTGFSSLASFLGISLLYIVVTRTGIQNEVEGGVVCFIILVLILLLLPALAAARNVYRLKNTADSQVLHRSRACLSLELLIAADVPIHYSPELQRPG